VHRRKGLLVDETGLQQRGVAAAWCLGRRPPGSAARLSRCGDYAGGDCLIRRQHSPNNRRVVGFLSKRHPSGHSRRLFSGCGGQWARGFSVRHDERKALPESPFGVCRVLGTDPAPATHLQFARSEVLASGFCWPGLVMETEVFCSRWHSRRHSQRLFSGWRCFSDGACTA
jgi:hypothetical protein